MKSPYFFGERTELEKGKYKTREKHFIMSKRKEGREEGREERREGGFVKRIQEPI